VPTAEEDRTEEDRTEEDPTEEDQTEAGRIEVLKEVPREVLKVAGRTEPPPAETVLRDQEEVDPRPWCW